jgi:hypothetical protein
MAPLLLRRDRARAALLVFPFFGMAATVAAVAALHS